MTTPSSESHRIDNGRPTRRRFTAEYKLRILEEIDRNTERGGIGEIIRREGLYSSQIAEWKRWRRRHLPDHSESKRPATESQLRHELARVQRENQRLQIKLEHKEKLLQLQKKFAEIMEATPSIDINNGRSR